MANIPDYKTTKAPVINDHPQVVMQPYNSCKEYNINPDGPEAITNGYNGMKDPLLKLSQNMKLATRHVDINEKAVPVSDEWKWVDGKAVPPVGRFDAQGNAIKYTEPQQKKYSSYGNVTVEKVAVEVSDPQKPWHTPEMCDTVVVTAATESTNDDQELVEAVPVLAVEAEQKKHLKTEGRRGEVIDDPIDPENYLDRPGMEIKTSETYMAQLESESEPESESESDVDPEPPPTTTTRTIKRTTKTTTTDK